MLIFAEENRRMKKFLFPLLLFLMLLSVCVGAQAEGLSISAPATLTPYRPADIIVSVPADGTLSVHVSDTTLTEQDIVTNISVTAGEQRFSYDGLSYNGQPLRLGEYALTAEFVSGTGEAKTAQCAVKVLAPLASIEYALPLTDTLYQNQSEPWYLDVKLSAKRTVIADFALASAPEDILYSASVSAREALKNYRIAWKGLDRKKNALPTGEYIIRTYSKENPSHVIENHVQLVSGAPEKPAVEVSGDWYPENYDDDAVVWAKLMEPITVIDAAQMSRAQFYEKPNENSKLVGSVYGTTVAVRVLELNVGKFARIGAYCSYDGEYREGYILQKYLKTVYPNTRYGAVIDKAAQTMTVYGDGQKLGVMQVSTGVMAKNDLAAETRAGVYLTFDRITDFHENGFRYDYPIRIDGPHLIHQMGYTYSGTVKADFTKQSALLGTKASHGCVRMNAVPTAGSGGINAYWCWTHFCVRTKIIVIDDTEARQAQLLELKGR